MAVQISTSLGRSLTSTSAPSNGTSEIQTLTIGGTPNGGTFKLAHDGQVTASISWSATDATLVGNIDTALEALGNIGTGNVTTAAGTVTNGIGTITIAFANALGKLDVALMTVNTNALTGTSPTLAIATTTAGVTATGRGYPKGKTLIDSGNGKMYINVGTNTAPGWVVVGSQS